MTAPVLAQSGRTWFDPSWIGNHLDDLWQATVEHLLLTGISVAIGIVISTGLAVVALRWRWTYGPLSQFASVLYTIPSLAAFALLWPLLGGVRNQFTIAVVALTTYTVLILLRNIVTGIEGVDAGVREAAVGMGYRPVRLFVEVQLPLALPTIIAGIRIATVTVIGLVTVTALIGLGGRGRADPGRFPAWAAADPGAGRDPALGAARRRVRLRPAAGRTAPHPVAATDGRLMLEILTDAWAWFTTAEQWTGPNGIPARTLEHLELSVAAILVAVLLAVPPALVLAHKRRAEFLASAVVNTGRAVPSFGIVVLAALVFLTWGIPVRFWSTVVALIALALPPIFTNTYSAVRNVDPATVEAARGMGLTERQLLVGVELPIAAPVMLTGIRIAWAQVLATATLGAVISSGGGLGRYIVDGFAVGASGYDEVFGGAILVAALTLLGERAFDLTERLVLPTGIKRLLGRVEVEPAAPAS